ncbi:MAG: extracellular solute-binding protein [Thermoflexales bacterium]|nr:extracellular solute-binding protein [Thermoflexales bacterium]
MGNTAPPSSGGSPPAHTASKLLALLLAGVGSVALVGGIAALVILSILQQSSRPAAPIVTEEITLVLWIHDNAQGDQVTALANAFQAQYPNLSIQVTSYSAETLLQILQDPLTADRGPDVLWATNEHTSLFTTADIVQPVDKLGFELELFLPSLLEAVRLDGKTWGVPLSAHNNLMLLYNKDLVQAPPQDTQALITLAQELSRAGVQGFAYYLDEPFWLAPWLGGYDGAVFERGGGAPSLDTAAMRHSLQLLHDFKFKHAIVPQTCDYVCADSLFKQGKAAMIINGDWALAEYVQALGDKLGAAPIPQVSGVGWPQPYVSGTFLMFPKKASGDKLNAAKLLALYATSEELSLCPTTASYSCLPAVKNLLADEAITGDPLLAGAAQALQHSTALPPQDEMSCVWEAMRPALVAVMADKLSPAEAAAAMQAAAETCIAGKEQPLP